MPTTYFRELDVSKLSIGGSNVSVDRPYVPLQITPAGVITLPSGLTAQGVTAFTFDVYFSLANILTVTRPGTVCKMYKMAAPGIVIRNKSGTVITDAVGTQNAVGGYITQDNYDISSNTHNQLAMFPVRLADSTYASHTHGITLEWDQELAADNSNLTSWWNINNVNHYVGLGRFVTNSTTYSYLNDFKGVDTLVNLDASEAGSFKLKGTWAAFDLPPTSGVNWDELIYGMPLLNTFKQTA